MVPRTNGDSFVPIASISCFRNSLLRTMGKIRLNSDGDATTSQMHPKHQQHHAARRPLPLIGASVNRSPNGLSSRLSVACVGLCRGLIARSTFELATPIFFENSFTPIAR